MFPLASVYMCVAERGIGGSGSMMGKGWLYVSAINVATMRRSWRMPCGTRKVCVSLSSSLMFPLISDSLWICSLIRKVASVVAKL